MKEQKIILVYVDYQAVVELLSCMKLKCLIIN